VERKLKPIVKKTNNFVKRIALKLIGLSFLIDFTAMITCCQMPDSILSIIERGEYTQARQQLNRVAHKENNPSIQQFYQWEAERLRRIRLDYPLKRTTLFDQLKKRIHGVKHKEMQRWIDEGRFDWRKIDGKQRFLYPSVSNLFFCYPDVRERRITSPSNSHQRFLADLVSRYDRMDRDDWKFSSPLRYSIKMTLTVKPDAVNEGDRIRCWLPIPQENSFQKDIVITSATPSTFHLANSTQPHRSVYMERKAIGKRPASFEMDYSYTSIPRYDPIDENKVTSRIPEHVRRFLREEPPHLRFLPEFQTLSDSITGEETNPCRIAKSIYDWMSENIHYRYAPEYSTIRNISHFTFERRYGDCGQMALLFMTLCRMQGIPARWESGWMFYPDLVNLHDWCVIYLDPYGWIPVDPTMAVLAMSYWDPSTFTQEEREKVRDFFFGRMDAYRMAANSNHGDRFDPSKHHFRSDTVDFQRGETETSEKNLYYDSFDYDLVILSRKPIQNETATSRKRFQ